MKKRTIAGIMMWNCNEMWYGRVFGYVIVCHKIGFNWQGSFVKDDKTIVHFRARTLKLTVIRAAEEIFREHWKEITTIGWKKLIIIRATESTYWLVYNAVKVMEINGYDVYPWMIAANLNKLKM